MATTVSICSQSLTRALPRALLAILTARDRAHSQGKRRRFSKLTQSKLCNVLLYSGPKKAILSKQDQSLCHQPIQDSNTDGGFFRTVNEAQHGRNEMRQITILVGWGLTEPRQRAQSRYPLAQSTYSWYRDFSAPTRGGNVTRIPVEWRPLLFAIAGFPISCSLFPSRSRYHEN